MRGNPKNLSSRQFGNLTVLEPTEKRINNGSVVWKCICSCGNIVYVASSNLINGHSQSCGCSRTESIYKKDGLDKIRQLYKNYILSANRRKYSWELTENDFYRLVKSPCHYCGSINDLNGVDRKDNSKGYSLENCVPCCKICNYAKGIRSDQEFEDWISKVYNHLIERKKE